MIYIFAIFGVSFILFYEKRFVLLMPIWIALTPKALLLVDNPNYPVLSLYKFFCACLLLRFVFSTILVRKGRIWYEPLLLRPLAVIFFAASVSVIANIRSVDAGALSLLGLFLEIVFPAYIYCFYLRKENHNGLKLLLIQYLVFYVSLAIYGSVCYYIDYNPYINLIESTTHTGRVIAQTYAETLRGIRAQGTISHPITYGAVLSLFLLLFFVLNAQYIDKKNALIVLFFSMIVIYAVFLTNSRSPLIFIIIAIIASMCFSGVKNLIYQLSIIIAILVMGFSFSSVFHEKIMSVVNILNPNIGQDMHGSTIDMRLTQLTISYKYFLMSPILGNGLDAIRNIVSSGMEEDLYDSESVLFHIMVNQGLIGIISYSLFFVFLYKMIYRNVFFKASKGALLGYFAGYVVFILSTGIMDTLQYFVLASFFMYFYLNKTYCMKMYSK